MGGKRVSLCGIDARGLFGKVTRRENKKKNFGSLGAWQRTSNTVEIVVGLGLARKIEHKSNVESTVFWF